MEIGRFTYGADKIATKWVNGCVLKIGSFCSIADNVTIYLGGNHRTDWITTYPFGHINRTTFNKFNGEGHPSTRGNVVIGNDVWIGSGVTIMSGVKIGDGAVISNNSLVVSNVKPYAVVGGNPAQLYYFRFRKEIIDKLLQIKWWNLSEDEINRITPQLCSKDTDWILNYKPKNKQP